MDRDLRREWELLEPPPEATHAARLAALGATPPVPARPRWHRWRRRGGLAVVVAALLVAGAATATVMRPWDEGPRANATNPQAELRLLQDPLLSSLSWVVADPFGQGHISRSGPSPSVTFPPGVTLREAMTSLHRAVAETGELPAEATLGPPLPAGKVVRYPASAADGITLGLDAPFGYAVPGGQILTPTMMIPAGVAPEEVQGRVRAARDAGRAVPEGAVIDTSQVTRCQEIRPGQQIPTCRLAPAPPDPWQGPTDAPTVAVPDVAGMTAGDAADTLAAAGLRAYYLPVLAPAAVPTGSGAPVDLDEVRDSGAWRKAINRPVVSGTPSDVGDVLAVYPAAGDRVRQGTRIVLAARSDDCSTIQTATILQATCIPGTEAARQASPQLRQAPWLYTVQDGNRLGPSTMQQTPPRPSLRFPAGVSRAEALRSLYLAAVVHGRLPAEATLEPPLPAGTIYQPAGPGGGVRIDLRAPFGYSPDGGHIYAMGLSFRGDLTTAELEQQQRQGRLVTLPVPLQDQVLPIPELAPCQITDPAGATPPCKAAR